jgi:hypothetical protein
MGDAIFLSRYYDPELGQKLKVIAWGISVPIGNANHMFQRQKNERGISFWIDVCNRQISEWTKIFGELDAEIVKVNVRRST